MSDSQQQGSEGQVSEVGRLDQDDSGTPIAPEDATAGYPTSESGEPEESEEVGPDARTGAENSNDVID